MSDQNESLTVALLLRVMTANRFRRSLKKSNWAKGDWAKSEGSNLLFWLHRGGNCGKNVKKTYEKYGFLSNCLFFRAIHWNTSESLTSLFFKEIESDSLKVSLFKEIESDSLEVSLFKEIESDSLKVSLFKEIESDSLKVSLLKKAMRAIRSRSLFWKERWERFAHGLSF